MTAQHHRAPDGITPTGMFSWLLRRFSGVLQTTNSWFEVKPARLLRRPQIFAAGC
jgi:hypothetical protein